MYTLNNEVLESFVEINRAIYKLLKKDADRAGLTVVQLRTLHLISLNPNIGLGDLAEKLKSTNSTVSGVIDRLVQHDFVVRVVPPENRRSVSIHLTDKGKGIFEHFMSDSIFIKKMNELLNMPKENIEQLLKLHENVLSIMNTEEEQ
ncbi:MarR family transcriptional regulator [Bacillus sp. BRMEA1]|uniref:MarR family winged helix-turn-helix transcriptional regulator n=1 Tax=Neobacillus endophyticus TaxID=2738405 RepID=UPI0015648571|nr:MarR family transcriptional regulator [Neobacillus endophyticus]NRD80367.1 MarR family transcriptional regulator [Neobacillus endophyticus]